jgi:hypothetical protein
MQELGLSLDQIKHLVADNDSADDISGILLLKEAQIE